MDDCMNKLLLLLTQNYQQLLSESTKDTYEYVPSVRYYMKVHRIPTTWHEAKLRCQLEGMYLIIL